MNRVFIWLMQMMPQILCVAAVVIYLSSVVAGIAAGHEMDTIGRDTLPVSFKARSVVILFVQPLILPIMVLFGAALLWRLDRWSRTASAAEAAE